MSLVVQPWVRRCTSSEKASRFVGGRKNKSNHKQSIHGTSACEEASQATCGVSENLSKIEWKMRNKTTTVKKNHKNNIVVFRSQFARVCHAVVSCYGAVRTRLELRTLRKKFCRRSLCKRLKLTLSRSVPNARVCSTVCGQELEPTLCTAGRTLAEQKQLTEVVDLRGCV